MTARDRMIRTLEGSPKGGSRFQISRGALLRASAKEKVGETVSVKGKRVAVYGPFRTDGLERLAAFLGIGLPHMPRAWHGYRRSLVDRLVRVTKFEVRGGWA